MPFAPSTITGKLVGTTSLISHHWWRQPNQSHIFERILAGAKDCQFLRRLCPRHGTSDQHLEQIGIHRPGHIEQHHIGLVLRTGGAQPACGQTLECGSIIGKQDPHAWFQKAEGDVPALALGQGCEDLYDQDLRSAI